MKKSKVNIKNLALTGLLTAIVAVLQYMAVFLRLNGLFSVSLVLVPIVIGAALCGKRAGAWLGFVFSVMVFVTGDATLFLGINFWGTVVTVLLKGMLAGFLTALVYQLFANKNRYVAVIVSAIVCPVVNTGIFLLGSRLFFYDTISQWALEKGQPVGVYMLVGLVGLNFVFELLVNVILAPVIVRLVDVGRKAMKGGSV